MKELTPKEEFREWKKYLGRIQREVLLSPLPLIYESLKKKYQLRSTFSFHNLPPLRFKIRDKDFNLIGYLDYSDTINVYSGNHYFSPRKDGESAEIGGEGSKHFRFFDKLMKRVSKDSGLKLVQTMNYGKFTDPRAYDIWSLVDKIPESIFKGIKTINLCLVWGEEAWNPERAARLKKLRERARDIHKRATEKLKHPLSLEVLKTDNLYLIFDEMRHLIHDVKNLIEEEVF